MNCFSHTAPLKGVHKMNKELAELPPEDDKDE